MTPEQAEEYTDALGSIAAGSWRQVALGVDLDVPAALGLTVREWVDVRLGGYVRLAVEERQAAARELAGAGMKQRQIADVLGVGKGTVDRDLNPAPNGAAAEPDQDEDDDPAPNGAAAPDPSSRRRLEAVYSSGEDDWPTPPDLFDELNREFDFALDVCASAANAKCGRYFTSADDGLAQPWEPGPVWMNPPYGDAIGAWMAKAHETAAAGGLVVCLVPARTDTGWWWRHAIGGEVRFLRGRLRFGEGGSAPFPSAVVVLGRPAAVVWWER